MKDLEFYKEEIMRRGARKKAERKKNLMVALSALAAVVIVSASAGIFAALRSGTGGLSDAVEDAGRPESEAEAAFTSVRIETDDGSSELTDTGGVEKIYGFILSLTSSENGPDATDEKDSVPKKTQDGNIASDGFYGAIDSDPAYAGSDGVVIVFAGDAGSETYTLSGGCLTGPGGERYFLSVSEEEELRALISGGGN